MSQSATRALRLFEYLVESGPRGLTEIADAMGLNKSTAYRFVSALVDTGYVRQDGGTRSYAATLKVVHLGARVLERVELRSVVRPFLVQLAARTGETAHLAVLDGMDAVYADKVEGRQAVNMASRIGSRGRCHSTSLGKVLLAGRPRDAWQRYVAEKGLEARTERTITDPERLFRELERVARQGYAVDNIENEEGIRCMAAPVYDHTGTVAAAMSVSGWTVSMTTGRIGELTPVVLEQAREASAALGHIGGEESGDGPEGRDG